MKNNKGQQMTIRIWNNDSTDYCDYKADTIEEIKVMCSERIKLPAWNNGWSERIINDN